MLWFVNGSKNNQVLLFSAHDMLWWPLVKAISIVHLIHLMNANWAQGGCQHRPSWLTGHQSASRLLPSMLPLPFIISTHLSKSRRLSQPRYSMRVFTHAEGCILQLLTVMMNTHCPWWFTNVGNTCSSTRYYIDFLLCTWFHHDAFFTKQYCNESPDLLQLI